MSRCLNLSCHGDTSHPESPTETGWKDANCGAFERRLIVKCFCLFYANELQSARLASKWGFKAPPLLRFLLFHRNQIPFFHNDRGRSDGSPGVIAGREGDVFWQRRRWNCSSVCRLWRESWLVSRSTNTLRVLWMH